MFSILKPNSLQDFIITIIHLKNELPSQAAVSIPYNYYANV